MREHLFRGKRIDNGEWTYGCLFKCWGRCYLLWGMNGDNPIKEEVYPKTVGEYTGLTDKNDKKIFEGDICKTHFESYTHSWGDVGVATEFCGAYGIESADGNHFRAFINESVYTRSREVIGNAHDNPELLEVEE